MLFTSRTQISATMEIGSYELVCPTQPGGTFMAETITLTKPVKATPQRVYQAFLEPTDLTQ